MLRVSATASSSNNSLSRAGSAISGVKRKKSSSTGANREATALAAAAVGQYELATGAKIRRIPNCAEEG